MKVRWQSSRHGQGSTARADRTPEVHDGGREMNTLHIITTSAVGTRLHDVTRSSQKSGVDGGPSRASGFERGGGRGCARGTGRQHTTYMSVVDAHTGEAHGGAAYGEGSGQRRSLSEVEFTAYVQERRASLYATAYHLTG